MTHHLAVLPENARYILLAVILLAWLGVRAWQFLSIKKQAAIQPGTERDYGIMGGAICPKCFRPVRLGFMAIKLGFGTKVIRCEFCGKWSIVQRASLADLRTAEAAELADARSGQLTAVKSESDRLKEQIDELRFTNRP